MNTVFSAKLMEKGVIPRNVRFQIAIAEFQNNGGTWSDYLNLGKAAYEKGSEGPLANAEQGLDADADASRRNESEGPVSGAEKARIALPSLSAERNGAGQNANAEKAVYVAPRPVSPAYIKAAGTGAKQIALTVLDSFKVRDGRAIGDVPYSSINRLIAEGGREITVLKMIRDRGVPPNPNAPIRLYVGVREMERIIQKAAEVEDHAA